MDSDEVEQVVSKDNKMRPHPQLVARIMDLHASVNAMPGAAIVG